MGPHGNGDARQATIDGMEACEWTIGEATWSEVAREDIDLNAEPIGQDARERSQKRRGKRVGDRHDAEPSARLGELPREPPDGDPLQPKPDERDRVAGRVQPVAAVTESALDAVESQTINLSGGRCKKQDVGAYAILAAPT